MQLFSADSAIFSFFFAHEKLKNRAQKQLIIHNWIFSSTGLAAKKAHFQQKQESKGLIVSPLYILLAIDRNSFNPRLQGHNVSPSFKIPIFLQYTYIYLGTRISQPWAMEFHCNSKKSKKNLELFAQRGFLFQSDAQNYLHELKSILKAKH